MKMQRSALLTKTIFTVTFFVNVVSCTGVNKKSQSEGISLKEDRRTVEELRKSIPPEKLKENDELKDLAELRGELTRDPKYFRQHFDAKMRKMREEKRKAARKKREEFTKNERRTREEFLNRLKAEKKEFKEGGRKKSRDQIHEFYKQQDLKRKDFYSNQRDARKYFDAELRTESRNFDSYYSERRKEFQQEWNVYRRRWQDREEEKRQQERDKNHEQSRVQRSQIKSGTLAGSPQAAHPVTLTEQDRKDLQVIDQIDRVPGTKLTPDGE